MECDMKQKRANKPLLVYTCEPKANEPNQPST